MLNITRTGSSKNMAKTNLQNKLVQDFETKLFAKVHDAIQKMAEYDQAIVKLPHQNETGEPVIHRDNKEMLTLRDLAYHEANVYWSYLTNDQQEQISKKFPNWRTFFVKHTLR
jgi:hypothetical protein